MLTSLLVSDGARQGDSILRLGLFWAGCLLMILVLLVVLAVCCMRLRPPSSARRQPRGADRETHQ
ncbi:hypothetical protein C8N44_12611 [Allosediminivita pacifica]|uniref:Uncharacterized protein n=1 Tax=Allosediminivita pacifica TaxID=1267769 RepID=A0A2T6ADE6_9RHOB|nr:hypothetical protein [Erythrobacter sp.]PTX41844.1 hypothetical protein C8N44_12611 [Allosediminivita pacifica]